MGKIPPHCPGSAAPWFQASAFMPTSPSQPMIALAWSDSRITLAALPWRPSDCHSYPTAGCRIASNAAGRLRRSMIPGEANTETVRRYAFVPSYVFYPSPGCWELRIRMGAQERRVVLGSGNEVQVHQPPTGSGSKRCETRSLFSPASLFAFLLRHNDHPQWRRENCPPDRGAQEDNPAKTHVHHLHHLHDLHDEVVFLARVVHRLTAKPRPVRTRFSDFSSILAFPASVMHHLEFFCIIRLFLYLTHPVHFLRTLPRTGGR